MALVDYLGGCVSTATLSEGKILYDPQKPPAEKKKREFHQLVEVSVPIADDIELNADIFRPVKKSDPKTVFIMVPGSGNISRKGEVLGDGISNYDEEIAVNYLWASSLAEKGIFVVSYDKRTCTKSINALCQTNEQADIESIGIVALANDLDRVVEYVRSKLNKREENLRIVLMSTTQGAQTIALSKSAKEVQGIVLLSPIVIDLETMWIKGLAQAAKDATPNQKMRLMNQKESMVSFFKSLKAGEFPETSIIRGASVKFWRTWIDATNQTVDILKKNSRPTLLMFSSEDSFSSSDAIASVRKKIGKSSKIYIKNISKIDRNFATKERVSKEALEAVMAFIGSLSPTT